MGNTPSVPGLHGVAGKSGFTPSDGFFVSEATRAGDTEMLSLFLKKNPGLVSAEKLLDPMTAH